VARVVDNTDSSQFDSEPVVSIDVETTTLNKGHPFNPDNRLISYAYTDSDSTCFKYYTDPDFRLCPTYSWLESGAARNTVVVGFNIKFDLHWLAREFGLTYSDVKIWDCSLAEFILSGQTAAFMSLNEALESYGLPTKIDKVKEFWDAGIDTADIPVPILEEYNKSDAELTLMLFHAQQQIMSEKQKALVYLEGEDLKTLQHAEFHGIKWDQETANKRLGDLQVQLAAINAELSNVLPDDDIVRQHFNWDSGDQLSALLYGGDIVFKWAVPRMVVGKSGEREGVTYEKNSWFNKTYTFPRRFTPLEGSEVKKTQGLSAEATHFYQVDEPSLKQLTTRSKQNRAFLNLLFERAKKIKVAEMIESIQNKMTEMNWQDNYIHGQFNQNVVVTGRLSSSAPNMQNTPVEVDELLVSRFN
jgi:DNA polymerase I-like protein with 3'-5' exonuclease and polymerase domains